MKCCSFPHCNFNAFHPFRGGPPGRLPGRLLAWPVVPACFACLPGCLPSCLPGCPQNCCLPGYYLCSTGRLQNCELPDLVATKRKKQKNIAKILLDLIIAGTLAEFPSKNPFRRATHAGTKHRIRLRTEILGIGVCGLGKV